jgi:tetratricopeptide (TPR) repeat protein
MDCPRCQAPSITGPSCPSCGVVFAKLRQKPVASAAPRRLEPERPRESHAVTILVGLLTLAGAGAWVAHDLRQKEGAAELQKGAHLFQKLSAEPPPTVALPVEDAAPLPVAMPSASWPEAKPSVPLDAVSGEERALLEALALKVNTLAPLLPGDVQAAERLYADHKTPEFLKFLEAVLGSAAGRARDARDFAQATGHLQRILALDPQSTVSRQRLVEIDDTTLDFQGMEQVCREGLKLDPKSAFFLRHLGFALFRQDRTPEALDALMASLDIQDDAATRALLAEVKKALAERRQMAEQRVAHFAVRYDGEAHEEVGREVVTALEHHYATLARTMDYELQNAVPVTLMTKERYYEGNPSWSGGGFRDDTARIEIPVADLGGSLTPMMDYVLLHELTHAFVNERSRGQASRDLHEGLAQYIGGIRMPPEVTQQYGQLFVNALQRADAHASVRVGLFYGGSLSFVEYLMDNRGQGGINDLLKAMGATGSEDAAYQQVYGRSLYELHQAWGERVVQETGR